MFEKDAIKYSKELCDCANKSRYAFDDGLRRVWVLVVGFVQRAEAEAARMLCLSRGESPSQVREAASNIKRQPAPGLPLPAMPPTRCTLNSTHRPHRGEADAKSKTRAAAVSFSFLTEQLCAQHLYYVSTSHFKICVSAKRRSLKPLRIRQRLKLKSEGRKRKACSGDEWIKRWKGGAYARMCAPTREMSMVAL